MFDMLKYGDLFMNDAFLRTRHSERDHLSLSYVKLYIYHDFLPTPRRGSHVKSDKTHTVIKIHPLTHILDT